MGLFDLEFHENRIRDYQTALSKLDAVIDWEMFRETLESALCTKPNGLGGRPPYDKVLMFKILILQKYYNLSDEQTEFQISDRTSFRQFLGLEIGDKVPDGKTIWLFKENLANKNLSKKLFELFTSMLVNNGIVAKEGSIVDASFVDVPRQRNSREENDYIRKGAVPVSFGKKDKSGKQTRLSQKDIDARWVTKSSERHFGYKNHINADSKTKIITGFSVSSASPHDSTEIKNIVDEKDSKLHADSAYRSEAIEDYLNSIGCESFVHEKGYRGNPLTKEQKKSNNIKSKVRARVEHVFGFMTNSMNNALFMRSIGIKRINSAIGVLNLTYNLFRFEQLVRLQKINTI
ncbi:IS5 family transposase [Francisella sp. SYW-2]|uniref:IS5 family transposase n=1 Tax=Francisella sp. SYW-2 TaxID=2610886 RepID=UPI00168CF0AC|nr:IS5 family transposase [Francisella sp. SYW-2]